MNKKNEGNILCMGRWKWALVILLVTLVGWYMRILPFSGPYTTQSKFPVLWMAPFFTRCGYGTEAIDYVIALEKLRPGKVSILHHGDTPSQEYYYGLPEKTRNTLSELAYRAHSNPISICHSEPGAWDPSKWPTSVCPPPDAVYKIGRTMFETDRIPHGWEERCNKMDEIWVPTKFHLDVFSKYGVDTSKLVVIPESVDVEFYNPMLYTPMELPDNDIKFKFLSIFKWEERKGWSILIQAFLRQFSLEDDVGLYILTHAYHASEENSPEHQMNRLLEEEIQQGLEKSKMARIHIIDKEIPTAQLPRLYKAVNAVVIPSRGEGWGRPHVEAMAMELPLIATFWSGPTEYMTNLNSYPLQIEENLVPIQAGAFADHMWASPSIKHLQQLMKQVVNYPEVAKQKGIQARMDMISKYHPCVVAEIVDAQLDIIQNKIHSKKEL